MIVSLSAIASQDSALRQKREQWLIVLWGLVLAISLLTADFQDPTLFHPAAPVEGISNGLGVIGALLGGTLLEWFGASALMMGWLLWRLPFTPRLLLEDRPRSSWFSRLLHALLATSSLSLLHGLFGTGRSLGVSLFWHEGYLGQVGRAWILEAEWPWLHLAGLVSVALWSLIRLTPCFQLNLPWAAWFAHWSNKASAWSAASSTPRSPLFQTVPRRRVVSTQEGAAGAAQMLSSYAAAPLPQSLSSSSHETHD